MPLHTLVPFLLQHHYLENCYILCPNMAPRLPLSKLQFIHDMIESESLTTSQMAEQLNAANGRSTIFAETCGNLETFMPLKIE